MGSAYLDAILADHPTLPAHPDGVGEQVGRSIRQLDGWNQTIDLYARPGQGRPRPAVLCLHGGGFSGGLPIHYRPLARYLAWRYDVVVASASYRLTDRGRFPIQVQDSANAMRWLRAEAQQLGIDKKRIGITGASAGGYLATMIALTHGDPRLAGGDALNGESAEPQALVVEWGPLDFIARWYGNGGAPGAEAGLLGTVYTEDPTLYHHASALTHAHAGAPPALFIYGNHDRVVHPQQGQLALAAWTRMGVPAQLLTLDGVGHVEPRAEDVSVGRQRLADFLAATLKLTVNPLSQPG